MGSKPIVFLNDEQADDDKAGDKQVDERGWVPGELKSVLGYQGTLVSLRLTGTGVSL